jgi:hypothetical protein
MSHKITEKLVQRTVEYSNLRNADCPISIGRGVFRQHIPLSGHQQASDTIKQFATQLSHAAAGRTSSTEDRESRHNPQLCATYMTHVC